MNFPDFAKKEPKICIIGAGFSGICAGIKLKTDLHLNNFTIFDENSEIGGIWLKTTYPGCACDVPSHLYSFSFELNPRWTTQYATQPEILAYLKNVTSKYALYSHIKFNNQIKTTAWDSNVGKWKVEIYEKNSQAMIMDYFDFVISGVGTLREPNIPEQFLSFKGPIMHSARWDSTIDLENKVVAIIGSGCSAVQIIPELEKYKPKKLLSFQRHTAWVIPRSLQTQFSEKLKQGFERVPGFQRLYRSLIFLGQEITFPAFKANSLLFNSIASWLGRKNLRNQVPDDFELRKDLTPDYRFGCKRTCPSDKYYKTFTLPHFQVIKNRIVSVKNSSIMTENGSEFPIEVLILATGYKVQDFWAPMKIIGQHSENILDTWKSLGPSHYLGIMTNTAPNLFFLYGPNTAFGHNSVIFGIECQMNWITQVLREMIKRKSQIVSPTKYVEEKYMKNLMNQMKNTVWGAYDCGSWYADNGIITHLYPNSLLSYWNKTRKMKCTKLEFA